MRLGEPHMPKIGLFFNLKESDQETPYRKAAFSLGLGRTDVALYFRHGGGNYANYDRLAQELIDLTPNVLFATCGPSFWALQEISRRLGQPIPIVFAGVIDKLRVPVPTVSTGYVSYMVDRSKEWLTYLTQIGPAIKAVAVLADLNSTRPAGGLEVGQITAAAGALGITVTSIDIDLSNSDAKIKADLDAFEAANPAPKGGVIVTAGTLAATRRDLIIPYVAGKNLPALYGNRLFLNSGGIYSYGAATLDVYRMAAGYVRRILDGELTKDIPVITNQRFEFVVDLSNAQARGVSVPTALRDMAHDIIA